MSNKEPRGTGPSKLGAFFEALYQDTLRERTTDNADEALVKAITRATKHPSEAVRKVAESLLSGQHSLHVMYDAYYTVVTIYSSPAQLPQEMIGFGVAKRHYRDTMKASVGGPIALRRAFDKLAAGTEMRTVRQAVPVA